MTAQHADEGTLDPWVVEWAEANGAIMAPPDHYTEEYLSAARPAASPFPVRALAKTTDADVEGIPIRIYEHDNAPTGVIVYFHGGGFCVGSIGLMEIIATELAHATGAAVVSVDYRLSPEHPYPAGFDDCQKVTRWAMDNAGSLGSSDTCVAVAGESAGGNLAAAVALRLRDEPRRLAAQVLLYPVLDDVDADHPSREQFSDGVFSTDGPTLWDMYTGGRDLRGDPFLTPLSAESLRRLPPAFVLLGGCDFLRDEGRLYAQRLRADGVDAQELCMPGQPHGFLNLGFPAAADAYEIIGPWLRNIFADAAVA